MSRTANDDQFQFLISCIRHSNNGKIDYTEVAKECSIVSRGAAVKRYSRLMKAHGINKSVDTTATTTPTLTGRMNTTSKEKTNGKRKTTDSETETDSNGKPKASKKGKKDKAVESAEKMVKKADLDTVKDDEDECEDVEEGTLAKVQGKSEDFD